MKLRHITNVISTNRKFHIFAVIDGGEADGFWGIEDKYFDENGKLTQTINGIQGHHFMSLNDTITHVRKQIHYDRLIESGVNEIDALRMAFKAVN